MKNQFEYYLDAYYAAVNKQIELEMQEVKNLVIVTDKRRHLVKLIESYKEGEPILSPRNKTIEVYRYIKAI